MRFMVKSKQIATRKQRFMISILYLLFFLMSQIAWTTAVEAASERTTIAINAYNAGNSFYRASTGERSHLNGGGPGWIFSPGPRGPRRI